MMSRFVGCAGLLWMMMAALLLPTLLAQSLYDIDDAPEIVTCTVRSCLDNVKMTNKMAQTFCDEEGRRIATILSEHPYIADIPTLKLKLQAIESDTKEIKTIIHHSIVHVLKTVTESIEDNALPKFVTKTIRLLADNNDNEAQDRMVTLIRTLVEVMPKLNSFLTSDIMPSIQKTLQEINSELINTMQTTINSNGVNIRKLSSNLITIGTELKTTIERDTRNAVLNVTNKIINTSSELTALGSTIHRQFTDINTRLGDIKDIKTAMPLLTQNMALVPDINNKMTTLSVIKTNTDKIDDIRVQTAALSTIKSNTDKIDKIHTQTAAIAAIKTNTDKIDEMRAQATSVSNVIKSSADKIETIRVHSSLLGDIKINTDKMESIRTQTMAVPSIKSEINIIKDSLNKAASAIYLVQSAEPCEVCVERCSNLSEKERHEEPRKPNETHCQECFVRCRHQPDPYFFGPESRYTQQFGEMTELDPAYD